MHPSMYLSAVICIHHLLLFTQQPITLLLPHSLPGAHSLPNSNSCAIFMDRFGKWLWLLLTDLQLQGGELWSCFREQRASRSPREPFRRRERLQDGRAYSCQRKMWDAENGMSSPYPLWWGGEVRAAAAVFLVHVASWAFHPSPSVPVSCLYFSAISKVPEPLTRAQCAPESKVIGGSLRQRGIEENCNCLETFEAKLCIVQALVTHWAAGVVAMRYGALFLSFFLFFFEICPVNSSISLLIIVLFIVLKD